MSSNVFINIAFTAFIFTLPYVQITKCNYYYHNVIKTLLT
uniref:Uncharacterized protein n=1 Tax=Anguilla anguilla TaxID=7936 RepID=A0A0E9TUX7_ANGAN